MKTFVKGLLMASAVAVAGATGVAAEGEKYILVSHAPDSDSWWNTIKNGIALAGEQMGVEVEHRNPPTGDLADMARIIDQAAASGPRTRARPAVASSTCASSAYRLPSPPGWRATT